MSRKRRTAEESIPGYREFIDALAEELQTSKGQAIMAYEFRFTVPVEPLCWPNHRLHWTRAYKHKRGEKSATRIAWIMAHKPEPVLPCRVHFRLVNGAKAKRDDDNLVGSFKYIRDALCECWGFDDRADSVKWTASQEHTAGMPFVEVHVRHVSVEGEKRE